MWQTKQYNKFLKTFNLDEAKFYETLHTFVNATDTNIWLLRRRHTRFYANDRRGVMEAPYELRQEIKVYFPFNFDEYLCRIPTGEVYLTEQGFLLVSGELKFPKAVSEIKSVEVFAKQIAVTELGLKVLLNYYNLPNTVSGCKSLCLLNKPCFYRLWSYSHKTPSRQWKKSQSTPANKVKEKKKRIEGDTLRSGVIVKEPRTKKGGYTVVTVRIDNEGEGLYELEIPNKDIAPFMSLVHAGTRVGVSGSQIELAGIVTIPY